ncbi:16S rRNA (uracil(1498)-N(3))-methyltransferase [Halothiobacillus sp. DCM-1]|uniref:16S rRNA (uracil(1498)-N(3))-methyltransferase n=1 Tax=Halothiobacillus sp. DCM-1 TaxID=3112558 RepID=UPI00324330F9
MRIPRLYLDTPLHSGATLPLPEERLNYLKNVLRLRDGFSVRVFNGRDEEASATLHLDRRQGHLTVGEVVHRSVESPLHIHLLQALGKGEKMDWVIQKAVELGVHRLTPLSTGRSVVELSDERAERRQQRYRDIAISACEQSGRNTLPRIDPIHSLAEALDATEAELRWILHPATTPPPSMPAARPRSAAILIGPEGGFSAAEVTQAAAAGFIPVTFGPRILRTETAPIVALTILQQRFGDFAAPE